MIRSLWKPWFLYRPSQIVRRVSREFGRPRTETVTMRLPWHCDIEADPTETIGRAIWTIGVYDLAVSEVLYRLTTPGAFAVDVGANIGYMTGLISVRAGSTGRVIAFEPHPTIAARLRSNILRVAMLPGSAPIEVRQTALSSVSGTARLQTPERFDNNHGLAFLGLGETGLEVETETLDSVVGDGVVDVMKLDVEGHESAVLEGAQGLLTRGRVTHIVFEEHRGTDSPTVKTLSSHGYHLFQIGWQLRGPLIQPVVSSSICRSYEAPSYLATVDPEILRKALRPRGWEVYR